jgi:hypothetical protein
MTTTNYPTTISQASALYSNGYVYLVGGENGTGAGVTYAQTVYFAKQGPDGSLSAWQVAGPNLPFMPNVTELAFGLATGGVIYAFALVVGDAGISSAGVLNRIAFSRIGSDGTVGQWSVTDFDYTVDALRSYGRARAAAIVNGNLFITTNILDTAQKFPTMFQGAVAMDGTVAGVTLLPTIAQSSAGFGGSGSWDAHTTMFQDQNRLYLNLGSAMWYGNIDASSGTPGPWMDTTPVPSSMSTNMYLVNGNCLAVADHFVYVLGGSPDGSAVWSSSIHQDGVLGAWSQTTPLPQPLSAGSCTVGGGFIYYVGGLGNPNQNTPVTTTYVAAIM